MGALLVVTALGACGASRYSAEPTQAWVVDKTTGKPIEGVVVVAHWELRWGFEGGSVLDMKVLEATTDAQGHFSIPGWGPEPIPREAGFTARMRNNDPGLLFFHPGYLYERLQNSDLRVSNEALDLPVRKSEHTGKRIALTPLPADDFKGRNISLGLMRMHLTSLGQPNHPAADILPKLCSALKAAIETYNEDLLRIRKSGNIVPDKQLMTLGQPESVCMTGGRR
jgi:hypothetical protein